MRLPQTLPTAGSAHDARANTLDNGLSK